MYEMIWKKFDQLRDMLSDKYRHLKLLYEGKGCGAIFFIHSEDSKVDVNKIAVFDSLGHLHHILTVFLESSYEQIINHELDNELERQERPT